jgi:predicted RND superfamily exporter protein
METVIMNKKIIATAVILGIGVAYCIHLLMGDIKPAKMNAPAKL